MTIAEESTASNEQEAAFASSPAQAVNEETKELRKKKKKKKKSKNHEGDDTERSEATDGSRHSRKKKKKMTAAEEETSERSEVTHASRLTSSSKRKERKKHNEEDPSEVSEISVSEVSEDSRALATPVHQTTNTTFVALEPAPMHVSAHSKSSKGSSKKNGRPLDGKTSSVNLSSHSKSSKESSKNTKMSKQPQAVEPSSPVSRSSCAVNSKVSKTKVSSPSKSIHQSTKTKPSVSPSILASAASAPSVVAGTRVALEPSRTAFASSGRRSGSSTSSPLSSKSVVPRTTDRDKVVTSYLPAGTVGHKRLAPVDNDSPYNDDPPAETLVGAFAINVPAPSYNAENDDDGEWEQFPVQDEAREQVLEAEVSLVVPAEETLLDVESQVSKDVSHHNKRRWYSMVGLIALLIVVVVVVVIVVAGKDDDDDDGEKTEVTPTPTTSPSTFALTEPPTINVQELFDSCFDNTKSLQTALDERKSITPNLDNFVEIELCQNTRITLTDVDVFIPKAGLTPALLPQSNMRIRCGPNGDLNDSCIVFGTLGGEILVHNHFLSFNEVGANNVTIEGIIFEGARTMVLMENGGDITFKNCLFRNSGGPTPILIQDESQGIYRSASSTQRVTFDGCVFEDISFGNANAAGNPEISAMVLATDERDQVVFKDCTFRDNNWAGTNPGNLIASVGAQIEVERSCFSGGFLSSTSSSPIFVDDIGNFVGAAGSQNFVSGTWDCDFVSALDSTGTSRSCEVVSDATTCQATSESIDFV